MKFLICILVVISSYAQTQTSWQGLRFGMNRQQVRETLSAKSFSLLDGRDATTSTVMPEFELKTNSAILSSNLKPGFASAPMFFKPEVAFDHQGNLQTIKLDLDQSKVAESTPALRSNVELITYIAGTSAYEQLTGKYGPPAVKRGPCDNIHLHRWLGR
jgi:hypothetical protein